MKKKVAIELGTSLNEVEKELIVKTLEACKGHRGHTASALQISIRTLQRKLKAYALTDYLQKHQERGKLFNPDIVFETSSTC